MWSSVSFKAPRTRSSVGRLLQSESSKAFAAFPAFLQANSLAYEWLVKKVQAMGLRRDAEATLGNVTLAAEFAAGFHPGRFADGAIENIALEIGADLDESVSENRTLTLPVTRREGRRRVLHVASNVLGIGGHSRMLCHWIQEDQSCCHSLALVNQKNVPIPQSLSSAVRSSGGQVVVFPTGSRLCDKAAWLREMARRSADLVVAHHAVFDVVPTVAFSSDECPPVALLNHADHQFWLGSSVSDLVINLRTAGSEHTGKRRFVSSNTVVPIPLVEPVDQVSRQDARRSLGIPETQIVLLSIGRAQKYRPCGPYDFVGTANKILDRRSKAHLYVVGESPAAIAPYLRCPVHERLHFLGSIEDPSLYRAAADIYLEPFPFGTQTALLEAALGGLAVVPAYAPLFPLLVANDDALLDLIPNPHDEQEYLDRVDLLIQQPARRVELGESLRSRLLVDHVGEGWLDRLSALYQETDRLTHRPRPIPVVPCSTTDADIRLSQWHVMGDGQTYSKGGSPDDVGAIFCHTAFVAKYAGDYATARRFAWRALRNDPYRVLFRYGEAVRIAAAR